MGKIKDLTHKRFGNLIAEWPVGYKDFSVVWLCLCKCGNLKCVPSPRFSYGITRSCGCLARQNHFKHGHARKNKYSPAYQSWTCMKARCNIKSHPGYKNYGGRGIKICKRWRKFENFLADMGNRKPGRSLDRYPDPDGNYRPGNCRWATRKQQRNNMRVSR